ncbi:MAG: acyltransferase [Nitrosomonas sp.]|nr:acyltransferase [Nitrosomonas sp.]MCW5608341.1 acyltransferase [Nitrosomonas sp.]
MTKSFSIYLDFIRFSAAFVVLLWHSRPLYDFNLTISNYGHEAVIVFFILSGFVIAYVTDTKEKTLKDYAISRAARIYSVAIPAIIITALVDFSGYTLINSNAYSEGYQAWDYAGIRIISSLLFTNELWILSTQLFSNVPYWSLNYEVWYYIAFAILTFVKGYKRWLFFGAVCLFVGPKIFLLMPVWWLGVYIYQSEYWRNISIASAIALFLFSIYGVYLYSAYNIDGWGSHYLMTVVGPEWHREFAFSRYFITDYYLGAVIAAHFIAVRKISLYFAHIFNTIEKPVRILAGSTFTLYLLHQPLLWFFYALFYTENPSLEIFILIVSLTFATAFLIALVTEQKKHLWKKWITRLYNFCEQRIVHRRLFRRILR